MADLTPQEFKTHRNDLNLTLRGFAALLRMGKHGWRTVQRWEAGTQDIPGYASLLMEIISTRQIPDLTPFKRIDRRIS
jgi:DNA-binding transcriptional regulator YiaG